MFQSIVIGYLVLMYYDKLNTIIHFEQKQHEFNRIPDYMESILYLIMLVISCVETLLMWYLIGPFHPLIWGSFFMMVCLRCAFIFTLWLGRFPDKPL